ncbi:lytic transglycosylase domain-containing protein [Ramlibacter sp. 2FC]|uniref:lytic transglycosylase domain-containing protein n=1 Tax=Ramlibacter sp. 2FC TaxID=2502188 RepID=UPI0010F8116A|nr:lytic transglycosylase domain-containing protein [Ramlibacter sp. 2FC]
MYRIARAPAAWASCLVWAACIHGGGALAQTAAAAPAPAALLEDEPPALRGLMHRASKLEAGTDTQDKAWQAAALYCEASRLGSIEGQYRLGMLYAFGRGVPESRPLAAALFSQAAAQGHAEAGKMLDSIQLSSAELPACVTLAQLPEKAAPPAVNGLSFELASDGQPAIDRFIESLPAHKRWVVPLTRTLSAWYALDPRLVLSVIAVESNFETGAQSPKAAMGLMQLIPDTAERFNVRNAYNATQNLRGGMAYLRWLLSYYRGNIAYALAAYNAGEGRVDHYKGVPPFPETRAYVRRVIGLYGQLHHGFDESLTEASSWLNVRGR